MIDKYVSLLLAMIWSFLRSIPARISTVFKLYFSDFRVIEFTTAVGAAFAAVNALCGSMSIPADNAHKIALFGAAIGAICFIRNPKTKEWKDGSACSSVDTQSAA